jgi:small subunit ribosomal protein S1
MASKSHPTETPYFIMLLDDEKEITQDQQEETTNAAEETAEEVVETVAAETEEVVEVVAAAEETVEAVVETPAEVVAEAVVEAPAEVAAEVVAAAPVAVVAEAKVAEAPAQEEEEEEEVELPAAEPEIVTGGAHDDFNWNMDKRGALIYSKGEQADFLAKYDATLTSIEENSVIRGKVSAISGGDVVLDINYKSDGLIPMNEFRDTPDIKAGDEVEVYVESPEGKTGNLGLSRKKAKILRAWESIVDSFKNGTIIRGTVISKTKGGLIVDCNGLETFLPGSQIDIKPVVDYDQYLNKVMEFKVVKVNETIKNAVVSHKALIESDLAEQREHILASLDKGQVLEGIVKNITDFGAFLDLGGVDGLLYITDISWGRIQHPSEALTLNQRVNVVVLDFDDSKKRISLGLKQLTPHPWDVLAPEVVEGSLVTGKIVNIEEYGAFVEIQPGVEGLIHVSEISWGSQNVNAKEYFKMNQDVEARVVSLDRGDRKMSLSIKQITDDPWSDIESRFPAGARFKGTVKNITNYGIFVELQDGIGGMVHISDLSWTKRYAHPSEFTKPGNELDVVVLDIDKDKRQISLGHKQTQDNPWDNFETIFPIGSYHEATVLKRDDKGATFQMPHSLEAFAPSKHIRKDDGQTVEPGEVVTVKVIEFNKEERRILVSHTRYLEDLKTKADTAVRAERTKEANETQAVISKVNTVEKETLGDLAALAQLKEQFGKDKED